MSEDPYHWRNYAADEKKADEIRALLKMPNLDFQYVLAEVSVVIDHAPEVEVHQKLRDLDCELTTTPVGRTKIAFKHSKHLADKVIVALEALRYATVAWCFWCLVAMSIAMYRSEFILSDFFFLWFT